MDKEELLQEIRFAFANVTLEDGIGLWEGQAIDDYANSETLLKFRKKDERDNWNNLPYEDLVKCQSSLSFFDAKGMRFCLAKFLIFDILEEQLLIEQELEAPDVIFTLSYNLNEPYQLNRFSFLDNKQIIAVVHYLEYKLKEIIAKHTVYKAIYGSTMDTVFSDDAYIEIVCAIKEWKLKL